MPPHTFIGPANIAANTGVNPFGNPFERDANFPTVRSYQDKFDEFVSVLDYGAIGDGNIDALPNVNGTDNAGAFYRATLDLYSEVGGSLTDPRKRMALRVPAGIYRISRSLLLYPFSAIIGDGIGKTIIVLDTLDNGGVYTPIAANSVPDPNGPEVEIGNECVVRTCDSNGVAGDDMGLVPSTASLFTNPAQFLPQDIFVAGITFITNAPQIAAQGFKDVAKIEDAEKVRWERVRFEGNWTTADAFNGGSRALDIASVASVSPVVPNALSFIQCEFADVAFAINITVNDVTDVNVVASRFRNHYRAVKLGFEDLTIDPQGGGGNPSLFRISNSLFDDVVQFGLDNRSSGRGIISSFNNYDDTFLSGVAIRLDDASDFSVSIGDTFGNTGASICTAGQLNGPRVIDNSTADTNVIMNAQDPFHVPSGFCGDFTIDGSIVTTGPSIIVNDGNPEIFSGAVTPVDHVTSAVFPFADGNHIVVEYGLEIGGVYRNGTLSIIHDGSPTTPTDLNYQDSFVEFNGPPSNTVNVFAEANISTSEVEVIIEVQGAPSPHADISFNYSARLMTV